MARALGPCLMTTAHTFANHASPHPSPQPPTNFPPSSLAIPLPTSRLATIALQAISVDPELSPLVQRKMKIEGNNLIVDYKATTNRMLRVATNSFMASLKLVIEVMEKMDEDVLGVEEA